MGPPIVHSILMPVAAVVDKSYSGSDFYFMNDSSVTFTLTKPKTITEITTSIHLPDGSLARIDGNSCVIYQISRTLGQLGHCHSLS